MIHSQEEAERLLQKFLVSTVGMPASDIKINAVPDPSGDFICASVLTFNGKKVKVSFQVSHYGQMLLENEPATWYPLDNGGDMTEFWKLLFKQYLLISKKKDKDE